LKNCLVVSRLVISFLRAEAVKEIKKATSYLSVTFGYATATGLSKLLEGELSHDQLKARLYMNVIHAAYDELKILQAA
jgi:phage/plasmid primase-like uncharacterized protein